MPRRALRPPFLVAVALGAAAIAAGCSNKSSSQPPGCPAEVPTQGTPCDLPSSALCNYGACADDSQQIAQCERGRWNLGSCNSPAPVSEGGSPPPVYEAGPDGNDGGSHVYEAGPDVSDGSADGGGQDGGHVADATGDVAPDVQSE